jgi:transposase
MNENITAFVGLDVHKESIAIAVAQPGRGAPRFIGTIGSRFSELEKSLSHLGTPGELLIVYEAGPCGYVLARQLRERGYRCEVVAPTKIPRKPGDRVKTDRRDALSLAHFARAGDLAPVMVPDEADEAIRDLSRAREDALLARMVARHQLKALLLRHGHRYTGRVRGLWRTNASWRKLALRIRLNIHLCRVSLRGPRG